MQEIKVSIPATSANLGPGFDCLGLALNLRQAVTFTPLDDPKLQIEAVGEDATKIPLDKSNLVYQSAEIIFRHQGKRPPGILIQQQNHIPIGSGLGSSSSAVLAGMFGANAILGNPLTTLEILQMATNLEGHPDNVAPAIYGGLVLGVQGENGLIVDRIPIPTQRVAVILPTFDLLTADARAVLPKMVSIKDAIFNTSRVGLLIRALQTTNYDLLHTAMQDRLHQPFRLPLIPGMSQAFDAARQSGAAGVAISGAGPSLLAFAENEHDNIVKAVSDTFHAVGLTSRSWILDVDMAGMQIKIS